MNEINDLANLDRFEKVVSNLGLFVTENDKELIKALREDGTDTLDVPITAYASEDCLTDDRGFMLCLVGGRLYMCYETKYIDEKFYCNGSVPAFSLDEMSICEHLGNLMKEYKIEMSRKRKLKAMADFIEDEE